MLRVCFCGFDKLAQCVCVLCIFCAHMASAIRLSRHMLSTRAALMRISHHASPLLLRLNPSPTGVDKSLLSDLYRVQLGGVEGDLAREALRLRHLHAVRTRVAIVAAAHAQRNAFAPLQDARAHRVLAAAPLHAATGRRHADVHVLPGQEEHGGRAGHAFWSVGCERGRQQSASVSPPHQLVEAPPDVSFMSRPERNRSCRCTAFHCPPRSAVNTRESDCVSANCATSSNFSISKGCGWANRAACARQPPRISVRRPPRPARCWPLRQCGAMRCAHSGVGIRRVALPQRLLCVGSAARQLQRPRHGCNQSLRLLRHGHDALAVARVCTCGNHAV
jgi:hypothetical protein